MKIAEKSFQVTGIHPLNPGVFLMRIFFHQNPTIGPKEI
jgi:uncharacterized membrane protein YjjB (DUF3815 family)